MTRRIAGRGGRLSVCALLIAAVAYPALGQSQVPVATKTFGGVSQIVETRYYLNHPEQAPPSQQARFAHLRSLAGRGAVLSRNQSSAATPALFNHDVFGLPQNEESVSVCHHQPRYVIGGTNDYRGIVDPQGDFTGWQFSADGGRTVANEGLLPPVAVGTTPQPSGGDPVDVATGKSCSLYAADLNYNNFSSFNDAISGVGVYRTTAHRLATCPQGTPDALTHPSCWPNRRSVDVAAPGHFLDKEWMDAGPSGSAGRVVWVAYGDLSQFDATATEHSGVVKAVRCSADLSDCTEPIVISTGQQVAEYPDVTIGPDGRTYITWTSFTGGSFTGPAERGWFTVAQPGSTHFSAPREVFPKDNRILRGHPIGSLHANDFRLGGSMLVNTVKVVEGHPRVFASWTDCEARVLDGICEEARVNLVHSDNFGQTWSPSRIISKRRGDSYWPSLDTDPVSGAVVAAYYTNRYDPIFHNRQDVEIVRLSNDGRVVHRSRVTPISNETEADPLLGGFFIGDYIEVSIDRGTAYVHYNANEQHQRLLGLGVPIPQQDNYLRRIKP